MAKKKRVVKKATTKQVAGKKVAGKKAAKKRVSKKKVAAALEPPPADATQEKLDHYREVCELNAKLIAKREEFHDARGEARERRKELAALNDELVWLIRRGPDPQKSLDFPEDDNKPAEGDQPGEAAGSSEPAAGAPEWRRWTVDLLDLPAGVIKLLEENHLPTLGTLRDFWREGRVLHEQIKGLGEEKAAKVADAWVELSKSCPEINE